MHRMLGRRVKSPDISESPDAECEKLKTVLVLAVLSSERYLDEVANKSATGSRSSTSGRKGDSSAGCPVDFPCNSGQRQYLFRWRLHGRVRSSHSNIINLSAVEVIISWRSGREIVSGIGPLVCALMIGATSTSRYVLRLML